jgi:hypothetical protein
MIATAAAETASMHLVLVARQLTANVPQRRPGGECEGPGPQLVDPPKLEPLQLHFLPQLHLQYTWVCCGGGRYIWPE